MKENPETPELLDTAQVAAYLAIHKITVYKLVKQGKIPAFKIGGRWRFKKKILDDWMSLMAEKTNRGKPAVEQ